MRRARGLIGLLAVSAVTAAFAFAIGSTSRAVVAGPFGQSYDGLNVRREGARIPTTSEGSRDAPPPGGVAD